MPVDDPWSNYVPGQEPEPEPERNIPDSGTALYTPNEEPSVRVAEATPVAQDDQAAWASSDPAEEVAPRPDKSETREHIGAGSHSANEPHDLPDVVAQQEGVSAEDGSPGDEEMHTSIVDDDEDDDDDGDEPFVYTSSAPPPEDEDSTQPPAIQEAAPRTSSPPPPAEPVPAAPPAPIPAPVTSAPTVPLDYEQLAKLSSTGPLSALQVFFTRTTQQQGVSTFALANETNPTSGLGLAPLHYAAKMGQTDICKWLVGEAGAIVNMEDAEGETALHKAALAGKLPTLTFLLSAGASARALDADGWSPLHNACSKGYLDIARVLLERAGADVGAKGGRAGWTPLMNAASHGHLPLVRYLITKHHADPFARNAAGETAYDVAAATFEIHICEVLEKYERERWAAMKFAVPPPVTDANEPAAQGRAAPGQAHYNPLALHTTVVVTLYENQRLDTRLGTLAAHGGRPRWSGTNAGLPHKPDRRAPSTMPAGPLSQSRRRDIALNREDIKLPTRADPYKLDLPSREAWRREAKRKAREIRTGGRGPSVVEEEDLGSTPTPTSVLSGRAENTSSTSSVVERSHFWLSDWRIDLSHPLFDYQDGWQYAQSFDTPDERWIGSVPPPLARLLEGKGMAAAFSRAMTGGKLPGPGAGPANISAALRGKDQDQDAVQTGWVRRRRWTRVMRRRLDIEFGDELEAAEFEFLSHLPVVDSDGLLSTVNVDPIHAAAVREAQSEARSALATLPANADYVERAVAIAGISSGQGLTPADMMTAQAGREVGDVSSGAEASESAKRMARLEMAVAEVRSKAFDDADSDRRSHAEDLLKEYTVQLGQLRQAAGAQVNSDDEDVSDDEDDGEFIYPNSFKDDGVSVITRLGPGGTSAAAQASSSRPALVARTSSGAFGTVAPSEAGTSAGAVRSADLATASEFRVPTHETPNHAPPLHAYVNASASSYPHSRNHVLREHNLLAQWEKDEEAVECRGCSRRFTFFLRKHHCRRCGRIFCDACSSHRARLSNAELVVDPALPEMLAAETGGISRICNACDAERALPPNLRIPRGADALLPHTGRMPNGFGEHDDGGGDQAPEMSDVSSRASELNDCPVCNVTLAPLGPSAQQEEHVRTCLENGGGGSIQGGRYLVYKLPENSPIVGKECIICMEEFEVGSVIARLPCLCYFDRACIDNWIKRGRACPVHARSW